MANKYTSWDNNLLQMENPTEGPAPWLEKDAIYTALNKMKDGKAAGVSGIVAEMLKWRSWSRTLHRTIQQYCKRGESAK